MTRTPAHPVRVIAVAGVLVAVLLAVALASMLWNDRNTRLQAAQRQSIAMASGSDRLLRAQLITMERALRGTANDGRELFARVPEQAPALFEASIRGVLERNHDLVSITLVDGRGRPLSSGRGDPTLPEWVTTQNRVLSGELYVGALEELPGGHWTVRTALPVQPDQWLLARVRLGTFQEVVSGLDLGRDGVASIGNRYGQLLAHSRDPGRLVGRTLPTPMVMVPPSTEVIPGGVVTSPSDGQLRIAAISVPPDYPLILYTALSYQEVMARWYVFPVVRGGPQRQTSGAVGRRTARGQCGTGIGLRGWQGGDVVGAGPAAAAGLVGADPADAWPEGQQRLAGAAVGVGA